MRGEGSIRLGLSSGPAPVPTINDAGEADTGANDLLALLLLFSRRRRTA